MDRRNRTAVSGWDGQQRNPKIFGRREEIAARAHLILGRAAELGGNGVIAA